MRTAFPPWVRQVVDACYAGDRARVRELVAAHYTGREIALVLECFRLNYAVSAPEVSAVLERFLKENEEKLRSG